VRLLSETGDTLQLYHWQVHGGGTYKERKITTTFVGSDDRPGSLPLSIVPNPTDGLVAITATLPAYQDVRIMVVNALGQVVAQHTPSPTGGDYTWSFDTSVLPQGLYYVVVQTAESRGQALMQVWR
jgi:hypothetical protein